MKYELVDENFNMNFIIPSYIDIKYHILLILIGIKTQTNLNGSNKYKFT